MLSFTIKAANYKKGTRKEDSISLQRTKKIIILILKSPISNTIPISKLYLYWVTLYIGSKLFFLEVQ
jgi:hypothetical protein